MMVCADADSQPEGSTRHLHNITWTNDLLVMPEEPAMYARQKQDHEANPFQFWF